MLEPKFAPVDLTEMQDEGVLMAANEAFFWPLGLALTWTAEIAPVNPYIWCEGETVHLAHEWDAPLGHLNRCEGTKSGPVSNLHIREWVYEDGHHERIELDPRDFIGQERRARFAAWKAAREPLT